MLWAVSARCEPCFKFYVQQAVRLGAAKTDLGEFLAVASTMGRVRRRDVGLEGLQGVQRHCEGQTSTGSRGTRLLFLTLTTPAARRLLHTLGSVA